MQQVVARDDYAQLVRGEDRFGHFKDLPRPKVDFDEAGIAIREQVMTTQSEALYVNSERKPEGADFHLNPP